MKIVIYDTDQVFSEKLIDYVSMLMNQRHLCHSIRYFQSTEALNKYLSNNKVDILFYNFCTSNITNFHNITQINNGQNTCFLVFMSDDDRLVFHALKHHPYGFIRKSNYQEEVEETIDSLLMRMNSFSIKLNIKNGDEIVLLNKSDIYYIQKEKGTNYIIIYTNNSEYRQRSSITQFKKFIDSSNFISIGRDLLINKMHIFKISASNITFDNDTEIWLSEKSCNIIKKECSDLFLFS